MGSAVLGDAISAIRDWSANRENPGGTGNKGEFGSLVFDDAQQQKRLPKNVYEALRRTISKGEALDPSIADAVAGALKVGQRARRHPLHALFQPLTGITAEKHDSFLSPVTDGRAVYEFSGKNWSKASRMLEFPSGGMRSTFAKTRLHRMGPKSPPWLLKSGARRRSFIPTAFVSWTGEALDKRAAPALDGIALEAGRCAVEAVRLEGDRVLTTCGRSRKYSSSTELLSDAPRLDQRGSHAVRREAPRGRARGSVLWRDRRSRHGVHVGHRDRALQDRRAGEDPAQRSGAEPVRDRPDLREREPRHRSSDDDDGDHAPRGAEVRPGVPAPRKRSRASTVGQAT